MLRGATRLMQATVSAIGIVVLLFGVFLFPEFSREAALVADAASQRISPWFSYVNYTFLAGLYAAMVPFFIAIFQTMKLLCYINKKKAFSDLSVKALKVIKYCALAVCAFYMAGVMPIAYCFADLDDAPGVVLIFLVIGLAPFVIATFAAILQTLLREAIAIKAENDLTV